MKKVVFNRPTCWRYRTENFSYLFVNKKDFQRFKKVRENCLDSHFNDYVDNFYPFIFPRLIYFGFNELGEKLSNMIFHIDKNKEKYFSEILLLSLEFLRINKFKRLFNKLEKIFVDLYVKPASFLGVSKMLVFPIK